MCVSLKDSLALTTPCPVSLPFFLPVAAVSLIYTRQSREPWNLLHLQHGWCSQSHVESSCWLHRLRAAQVPGQVRVQEMGQRGTSPPANLFRKIASQKRILGLYSWGSALPSTLSTWDDPQEVAAQAARGRQAVGLQGEIDSSLGARAWVRSCVQRQQCWRNEV